MGSGGLSAKQTRGTEKQIILLMMPVYYTHDAIITDHEIHLAKSSWISIIEDKSLAYQQKFQEDLNFNQSSCISWFYSLFYDRLFDIHPLCRPLFTTGIISQGKFLVKMISLILNCLKNQEKFILTMKDLALRHCERGIRGIEYGIVGDVLFYTLRSAIGSSFTQEVENSWKLIYSSMLQIIVPLCVEYERSGTVKRIIERNTNSSGAKLESMGVSSIDTKKDQSNKEFLNIRPAPLS